jgi:hypothetical protein
VKVKLILPALTEATSPLFRPLTSQLACVWWRPRGYSQWSRSNPSDWSSVKPPTQASRTVKYSLFPPLGLATLAAYLGRDDEAEIQDEHVEPLRLNDEPDLVVIQVYITSAYRAYRIADLYDTRHAVFRPARMRASELEAGYWPPTRSSIAGGRSHAALRHMTAGSQGFVTSPMRPAGRSSSRSGISLSGRSGPV